MLTRFYWNTVKEAKVTGDEVLLTSTMVVGTGR